MSIPELSVNVNPEVQAGLFDAFVQAPLLTLEEELDQRIARNAELIARNDAIIAEYDIGADAYFRAMLEQETADPGSVDWNGVHSVFDDAYADCLAVDAAQSEYVDWRG